MLSPAELREEGLEPVSDWEAGIYRAIAAYAWDEAECHPSQETIARDVGCTRESVNRAVRRLIAAGWLAIKERRWSPRSRWCHNVYELLAPFVVGVATIKRITSRAHNTAKSRARRLQERFDHTNKQWSGRGKPGWCGCGWCKPDRGRFQGPQPLHLARDRLRPAGPGWRDELARRLRRMGRDPDLAYELDDRLDDLPVAVPA